MRKTKKNISFFILLLPVLVILAHDSIPHKHPHDHECICQNFHSEDNIDTPSFKEKVNECHYSISVISIIKISNYFFSSQAQYFKHFYLFSVRSGIISPNIYLSRLCQKSISLRAPPLHYIY